MALSTGVINGPQYARNYDLSGAILGFDSAQGDSYFRWRNEALGWKPLASNFIRNTTEQLGGRGDSWNQGVFRAANSLHRALGLDPQDAATTWRWAEWVPPKNSNHEADANNRWHLLVLLAAIAAARGRVWQVFPLGPLGGLLLFCFYLKWQPFEGRLLLPLFVLSAPLAGMLMGRVKPVFTAVAVAAFLVSTTRLPLTENWTRRLSGPGNLRAMPREQAYFNDMKQWSNEGAYRAEVARVLESGCRVVGVDIRDNQLEYPLQALLLARDPSFRFVHTHVENASRKYAVGVPEPCAEVAPGKP
jgi:hypothetical protein